MTPRPSSPPPSASRLPPSASPLPPSSSSPGAPPLPRLLVLTDRAQADRPLRDVVAAAVDGGARAVVLRERDLPAARRAALAEQLRALLAPVGGVLVVAGPDPLAGDRDGDETPRHLAARDPLPAAPPALLGRSCHDGDEVLRAAAEGCAWVTVSPAAPTASKPGYGPALREAGVARLAALPGAPPAYALGGVTPADAARWRLAGAAGVAVMGAVMRSRRPDRTVAALLAALEPTPDPRR